MVRADAAMSHLGEVVSTVSADDLLKTPGIRARLFRTAREIAKRSLARDGAPSCEERAGLPWTAPPRGPEPERDAVQRLRAQLDEAAAEILELRHVRGLDVRELAFTLGCPAAEVAPRIKQAAQEARQVLQNLELGNRAQLQALLVRAYTLKEKAKRRRATESFEPLESGDIVGGRYCIEQRVGQGAFGDVYRAQDTEVPGHIVALKLLHRSSLSDVARARALREVHLIASVFHPSVVQFKDHGWLDRRLWFVMPWYEGETLEARMERGAITRSEALNIFRPLAHALATMHAAGIRHQDIKPENIFLTKLRGFSSDEEQLLPILLDLGVAAKEAEMVVAGTPTYFAPEVAAQFTDKDEAEAVTLKADVFALALSLRNALEPGTQEEVHGGAVDAFIKRRASTLPPSPIARDLRYLDKHLSRWMSLDAEARPSAEEFAAELELLALPETKKKRRRALIRTVAPIGLALAIVSASSIYISQERAAHEFLRAEEALSTAELLREDLQASEQRGRELAEDVDEIRTNYARSRLTRQELATRLSTAESGLFAANANAEEQERRIRRMREEEGELQQSIQSMTRQGQRQSERIQELEAQSERQGQQLHTLRADLRTSRQRVEDGEARTQRLTQELDRTRRELDDNESRIASLSGQLRTESARLDAERAKSDRLEVQVAQAEAQTAEAQGDLARLRRQLRRARPPAAVPTETPSETSDLTAPAAPPEPEVAPAEPVAHNRPSRVTDPT